jgi:hypothetical protein
LCCSGGGRQDTKRGRRCGVRARITARAPRAGFKHPAPQAHTLLRTAHTKRYAMPHCTHYTCVELVFAVRLAPPVPLALLCTLSQPRAPRPTFAVPFRASQSSVPERPELRVAAVLIFCSGADCVFNIAQIFFNPKTTGLPERRRRRRCRVPLSEAPPFAPLLWWARCRSHKGGGKRTRTGATSLRCEGACSSVFVRLHSFGPPATAPVAPFLGALTGAVQVLSPERTISTIGSWHRL